MNTKQPFQLSDQDIKKLFDVISKIDSPKTCREFFLDLCTPTELKALSDRWQVARLIKTGKNYRDIAAKTGASTATVTRVARSLKFGTGGYEKAMDLQTKKAVNKEKK